MGGPPEPKRRGRPPVSPEARQDAVITVRVTAEEADALYRLASARRTTVVEMTRAYYRRIISEPARSDPQRRGAVWGR